MPVHLLFVSDFPRPDLGAAHDHWSDWGISGSFLGAFESREGVNAYLERESQKHAQAYSQMRFTKPVPVPANASEMKWGQVVRESALSGETHPFPFGEVWKVNMPDAVGDFDQQYLVLITDVHP